jgi:uncharacterized protein YkwD
MCSIVRRFVLIALPCVALSQFSAGQAAGQILAHRNFDVEWFDQRAGGDDAVDRPAAVEQILKATNEFRRQHDRVKLAANKKLAKAAQDFAEHMARTDRYGHQADGREPAERVAANEYDYCLVAENIAQRYSSTAYETGPLAHGFVKGWIDSAEHRKNILDSGATEVGIGLARSDRSGRYYSVQLFARPKSEAMELEVANHSQSEVEYQLGDEKFSLEPRVSRVHARCRPTKLIVRFPEQQPQSIDVAKSRRYVVRQAADGQFELAPQATSTNEPPKANP